MKPLTIYKLRFQTPLHLSRGKTGSYESSDSVLHSDTIKSALYVSALQLGQKDFADKLLKDLAISSAFPFDTKGCWLPRPVGFTFSDETPNNRKIQKKVAFFLDRQFSKLINGERKSTELEIDTKMDKIWEQDVTQRVWINGNENQSTPFYLEKLYPNDGTGLYFIVRTEGVQDFDFKTFEGVLELLGQNGIGLQRNLGNGRFKYEKSELSLDIPQSTDTWISLSLYRPENEQEVASALENDNTNYQFIKRGGWMSSPENDEHITIRKKSIMMFTEGSVFSFGKSNNSVLTKGKYNINLKPDWKTPMNNVYRDGRAIFLPIILEN